MSEMEYGQKPHRVAMECCKRLTLTGVSEVTSFDELSVVLVTSCGCLSIEGDDLHITRLDLEHGEADIEGLVTGLFYTKVKERTGGFFRRKKD
ncbi:MAG: YabP/YqfC family sporulation protein [Clostridia bacterium]|nr:YabP/YqfC family sporulation protein [Clostridia bacterium]MDY6184319.1 YabP/YqfC family sporulation protein [Eubacteriales bacterium]